MATQSKYSGLKFVFPMSFGFLMSNLVFALIDFDYKLFRDPFDLTSVAIDFITFALFFYIGLVIYERFVEKSAE